MYSPIARCRRAVVSCCLCLRSSSSCVSFCPPPRPIIALDIRTFVAHCRADVLDVQINSVPLSLINFRKFTTNVKWSLYDNKKRKKKEKKIVGRSISSAFLFVKSFHSCCLLNKNEKKMLKRETNWCERCERQVERNLWSIIGIDHEIQYSRKKGLLWK